MADQKWYDEGLRPRVLINWQSFVDWGLPSSWQGPFTDAVINAYTRWMNIGGVDLRFQFWGYTTKTESDSGELVISMNERHADSTRLASTFGSYNKLIIVFHRKRGSDLTPWNFVPYNAAAGEFDMQAILVHELGHCLGLDHSTGANDTMNGNYEYHRQRFGPFANDVLRLRNVYSLFTRNRLREARSGDGGSSWRSIGNDLTSYDHVDARTNITPGVAATPRSGLYLVGWTLVGGPPTWLRGDGDRFLFRHWLFYGGERSLYGPAYAHDDDRTMLWAWVTNDDLGTIKLVRSFDQGYQWHYVGVPASARTYGVPALAWTRVNGQSTWILVWPHFDRGDQANSGYLRASISTNDGASWSAPVYLNTFYKALAGVSATADAAGNVLVGFAWAPHSTYGMNQIRCLNCHVSGGQLQHSSTIYTSEATRIQPALALDANGNQFLLAWRGQNFNTTLNAARKTAAAASWSTPVQLLSGSHTAPALASSPEYGETALWYAYE
jgi:hypothetical protein